MTPGQMLKPLADSLTALARWFGTQPNCPWLTAEKVSCAQLLGQTVAGHVVQFELTNEVPEFFSVSPAVFHHRIRVNADGSFDGVCRGRSDELPLSSNSVQLLISHHSHEIGHQLDLRFSEWGRVLAANGMILLVSFNALGRSCDAPFEGLQRLRPDQLSKRLRAVGLTPQRSRAVLLPQRRIDQVLEHIHGAWSITENWVAGLAVGYVMSARKVDSGAMNMTLNHLQLKQVKHSVQGTAAG